MSNKFSIVKFNINPFDDSSFHASKHKLIYVIHDDGQIEYYRGNNKIPKSTFVQICESKLTYVFDVMNCVEDYIEWFIENINISEIHDDAFKRTIIRHLQLAEMGDGWRVLDALKDKVFRKSFISGCAYGEVTVTCVLKAFYYDNI